MQHDNIKLKKKTFPLNMFYVVFFKINNVYILEYL